MTENTVPIAVAAQNVLGRAFPTLQAVYQFGSAGTPYERPSSDVDLAFLADQPQDPVRTWNAAQEIATCLGRDVDLIDLRRASAVMAAQIIVQGKRLLCREPTACATFEMNALASYARLNEERAGILQDIQAQRRIHG